MANFLMWEFIGTAAGLVLVVSPLWARDLAVRGRKAGVDGASIGRIEFLVRVWAIAFILMAVSTVVLILLPDPAQSTAAYVAVGFGALMVVAMTVSSFLALWQGLRLRTAARIQAVELPVLTRRSDKMSSA